MHLQSFVALDPNAGQQYRLLYPPSPGSGCQTLKNMEQQESTSYGRNGDKRRAHIRVIDARRGTERDFTARAGVLGEAMRYFRAHLRRGGSKDAVSITVHCDVDVFAWLLQRAKAHHGDSSIREPELSVEKCVPLLVSGDFLQMDGLPKECTCFIARNLWQVCKAGSDLSKLEERFLSEIADNLDEITLDTIVAYSTKMSHTSTDLRALSTKLFKAKTELFIHRLQHELSRCANCGRIFPQNSLSSLLCPAQRPVIAAQAGKPIAQHERDPDFDLREFVQKVRKDREHSWRDIYWALFASSMALPECANCRASYLPLDSNLCSYHSQEAHQGIHPCCGSQATIFGAPSLNGCVSTPHKLLFGHDVNSGNQRRLLSRLRNNPKAMTLPAGHASSATKRENTWKRHECNNELLASMDWLELPSAGGTSRSGSEPEIPTFRTKTSKDSKNSKSKNVSNKSDLSGGTSACTSLFYQRKHPGPSINTFERDDDCSGGAESDDASGTIVYQPGGSERVHRHIDSSEDVFEDLTAPEQRALKADIDRTEDEESIEDMSDRLLRLRSGNKRFETAHPMQYFPPGHPHSTADVTSTKDSNTERESIRSKEALTNSARVYRTWSSNRKRPSSRPTSRSRSAKL